MEGWLWWWRRGARKYLHPSDDLVNKIKQITRPEENGVELALKEMRWSLFFSVSPAHTYPLTFSPPPFPFLLPLADLRCLLTLCLCPELSLLHCLMIDLQYSCPFPPHSPGQVPKWQPVRCFFMGADLLPLDNWSCCQKKRKCWFVPCAEIIYLGTQPRNLFEPTDLYFQSQIKFFRSNWMLQLFLKSVKDKKL